MNEYKRLTASYYKDRNYYNEMDNIDVDEMYDRLAELEDKIEQGLLLELPCKVGDTVYRVVSRCSDINRCDDIDQYICRRTCCDAFIRKEKFAIHILNRIGSDFFVTKEEAEAKLAELRGGE